MKIKDLECFIHQNGIKKQWLAQQLGLSPELFRYYMRTKKQFSPELSAQILIIIQGLINNCSDFHDSCR
jgi:hypothetical protein